jgi:cell fate regulator YaaT (PSP1 superfamily)
MSPGARGAVVTVRTLPLGWFRVVAVIERGVSFVAGDSVVVQTESGPLLGYITASPVVLLLRLADQPPAAKVIRRATPQDLAVRQRQEDREREAFRVGIMKIRERGLAMKLTRVEQIFDGSRLVFYFTAEGRVDFRELVRELASEFKTRIELRQIGVRDEARLQSGYGTCGRPLCCTAFLSNFDPISIKMAKQQDLALNPSRLSGLCGRLKCCLRYELPPGSFPKEHDEHPGAPDDAPAGPSARGRL